MDNSNDFLGTEPIGKLLFKLAVPAITAQLINMLYNLVDRIFIGHIADVGALALTGVGVCLPIILLISAFASLVSMGGSPRASIYMGKGDYKSAEKILGNCLSLLIVISIILTAVIFIWNEDLLLMFGASENTIGYASSYMKIYALGTIFVQLSLGMNAFITAQGFAKTSMYTVLIGAICNIILDPIFIFVLDFGVEGAAIATIISQAISSVWVIRFLRSKKTTLKIKKENLPLKKEFILPAVALGFAPFIMQSTESILAVCFNASLLKYGGDVAVGAMTILSSVMQFAMLPLSGLGQGAQPVISYNFGAGNVDRVKKTFKKLLMICLLYASLLWALVMLFPGMFAAIFTSDQILIDFTKHALRIYMATSLVMGIQMSCQFTLIALGNAGASVLIAIMRKIVILIPLIYILPCFFSDKTTAVYSAEPFADVLAVLFTIGIFAFQFKKVISKLEKSQNPPTE
ncbi:MAG: MATE family efflux transporter [Anaerovoracaceae bacterium]